jgi:hypothetical protein
VRRSHSIPPASAMRIPSAPRKCRPSRGVRVRHSCLRGFTRHRVTFVRPAYAASTSHRVT